MLSPSETRTIIEGAREFGVAEVHLFGSNLGPSRTGCFLWLPERERSWRRLFDD